MTSNATLVCNLLPRFVIIIVMKASIIRLDAFYEVDYSRPAFSRVASFLQIMEPIYDAFSEEVQIPSDAMKLENGDTIATAGVTLNLFSGQSLFEVKLDGYKAKFYDLQSPESIEQAKRHAMLFETVVSEFMQDGIPAHWKIVLPCWLSIKELDSVKITEKLIRNFTWLPDSNDPFEIGATSVSSGVRFDCVNLDESWNVGIMLNKSFLKGSDLFIEFSGEYQSGSRFETFNQKLEHLSSVLISVIEKLGLTLE